MNEPNSFLDYDAPPPPTNPRNRGITEFVREFAASGAPHAEVRWERYWASHSTANQSLRPIANKLGVTLRSSTVGGQQRIWLVKRDD